MAFCFLSFLRSCINGCLLYSGFGKGCRFENDRCTEFSVLYKIYIEKHISYGQANEKQGMYDTSDTVYATAG